MFSCFVLGKHTLNWLQASKLDEEREREREQESKVIWGGFVVVQFMFMKIAL